MQHIVSKLGLSGHGTVGGIGGATKQQLLWCHACRQKQLQHNASGVSSVKGKGEAQSLHVPAT